MTIFDTMSIFFDPAYLDNLILFTAKLARPTLPLNSISNI